MQLNRRVTHSRDEGAIAIIFAIVLVPILLSMGALLVDLGHLYADRREQQNAADAAALAVAADCAAERLMPIPSCLGASNSLPTSTAQTYASGSGNHPGSGYANGETSHVTEVCGTAPGLPPCAPSQGSARSWSWDCPNPGSSPVAGGLSYAQVRTISGITSQQLPLPNFFARFLTGNDGSGNSTAACARAAYGPVRLLPSFPVTISSCEWQNDVGSPPIYAPTATAARPYSGPPTPWPLVSYEKYLMLHSATAKLDGGCSSWQAGADGPGAFGWLDHPKNVCSVVIDSNSQYTTKNGNGTPQDCVDTLHQIQKTPQVIYIPIYSSTIGTNGSGSGVTYTLDGFAAFVVTGYNLPAANNGPRVTSSSWLTTLDCSTVLAAGSKHPDAKDISCLSGFFTRALVKVADQLGGQDRGVEGVKLIG